MFTETREEEGYVTEINKFMEYMEGREGPLMQTIKIHQFNTNSELLQTIENIKKYFRNYNT
jgi:hypothetical protein